MYVVNNDIEWTGNKVLHWIDLLKDVPALYVVKWIYVGRSCFRENRLPLSTENFGCILSSVTWPTFDSLFSKMYFRKKTFQCVMTFRLHRLVLNRGYI